MSDSSLGVIPTDTRSLDLRRAGFTAARCGSLGTCSRCAARGHRGGHHEALIKCLRIWSTVQAATFRSDGEKIDLLKDYPDNLSNRAKADATIRAMWGAHKGLLKKRDSSCFDAATDWARVFWCANSVTSDCIRQRDLDSSSGNSQDPAEAAEEEAAEEEVEMTPAEIPEGGRYLRGFVMDLMGSFVEALERAPSNLYAQERQEVVSGLVSRAGRDLMPCSVRRRWGALNTVQTSCAC